MPNWDDQFDFDDLDKNKAKPKPSTKPKDKKVSNQDDQFFDDVNSAPKNEVKSILPTINTRNSAKSSKPLVETPKVNPFANKSFGSKGAAQDDFQEDFQQEIEEEPKPKQQPTKTSIKEIKPISSLASNNLSKLKNQVIKQDEYDDEFYEEQLEQPLQKSVQNKKNNNLSKNSDKHLPTQPSNTVSKNQDQRQSLNLSKPNTKVVQKQEEDADDYQEEFQNDQYGDDDFQEEVKSPVKKITAKVNELVESIQTKSNPKLNIKTQETSKTIEPPPKNTSAKLSNNPPKGKQIQTRSQSVVPPKPPGNDKKVKQPAISSKNINKPESQSLSKPLKRSASRQSIRSNGDKSIKGSRISQRNESQFLPNKYLGMVDKSFPQDEDKLNMLSQLQINKINEKMRAMIRKFNEELNDLINKNMLLLKNKSLDKHLSLDERIRELEIQKKSGETAIQVMEKDFDKLQGREGELREEEYQLILEKQIEEKKTQIKDTIKDITVLKRQVDNKGKKLSAKQTEQQNAQNIHHLKTNIIQARKQQQKGQQRIQKLTSSFEELQTKISDIDYKLDQLISEARQKGVTIQNTDHMNKKYEELKTKLQNIKNFNTKAETLNNTKLDILNHENDQVRISIKNVTSQISNLYGSIDHSQSEAIKLIEKAKEKVGINPLFSQSLDKLLKQLEESRSNNDLEYFDARTEIKSRRSDSTKNRAQKSDDIEKSMPLRVTQSQNRLCQTEDPVAKPKFLKKKPEEAKLDIENKSKVNERVWSNESQSLSKSSVNDQNKHKVSSPALQSKLHIEDKPKVVQEIVEEEKKDKSKPFMLKKNKPAEGKAEEVKDKSSGFIIEEKVNIELSLPSDPQKNDEKQEAPNINLAPRMMKFGRKRNTEDTTSQNNLSLNENSSPKESTSKPIEFSLQKKDNGAKLSLNLGGDKSEGLRLQVGQPQKKTEEEDKPIFVPKRFNLRGKIEKKDDEYVPAPVKKDNSYTSSVEANIEKPAFSQKQQKKEEYQPKLNFLNDEPVKNPFKKEPEQPTEPQLEVKPRFNLRLRDKANTNQDSYEPSKVSGPQLNLNTNVEQSNQLNLQNQSKPAQNEFISPKQNIIKANDNEVPKSNPYNPYAPKVEPQVGIKLNVEAKKEETFTPPPENLNANNPYAAKFQGNSQETTEAPKRQRGPLRKNKISSNMPKQSFNIYAQADDITNEVKEIGAKTTNQNVYNAASNNLALNNPPPTKQNEKLNINDMLGIKKDVKKNDFDDLLGDVGVANAKNKKKNNDFFNDLQF